MIKENLLNLNLASQQPRMVMALNRVPLARFRNRKFLRMPHI